MRYIIYCIDNHVYIVNTVTWMEYDDKQDHTGVYWQDERHFKLILFSPTQEIKPSYIG